MVPALRALIAVLRTRMEALVALPDGEQLVVEEVRDEPWWAFNYYLGDLRSRVVVNSDQQTTAADLVTLAAHEAYPGHHTERVVKEQLLVRAQGYLEESIQLVPTPQSLVGEGIAEHGLEVVLDDELQRELEATLTAHGLDGDLARALAIGRARQPIRGIGLDVALMIHELGLSTEEARAHYERWAMSTPERSASAVRFATDPTWRAYAVTYSVGQDLCSRYVAGDRARFRTLLTEQVRVGDLLAASAYAREPLNQAEATLPTWRWSVPQQPPRTVRCGSRSPISRYSSASWSGSPSSSTSDSSSSAWLFVDAFARTPRTRCQGPGPSSTDRKWVGWAQLTMKYAGAASVSASTCSIASARG